MLIILCRDGTGCREEYFYRSLITKFIMTCKIRYNALSIKIEKHFLRRKLYGVEIVFIGSETGRLWARLDDLVLKECE